MMYTRPRRRTSWARTACIARRGSGVSETFTVRKISNGVGVERIFPVHAPTVKGVEVVRRGRVRRAKLYYLRGRTGKAARIREQTTGHSGKLDAAAREEAAQAKKDRAAEA